MKKIFIAGGFFFLGLLAISFFFEPLPELQNGSPLVGLWLARAAVLLMALGCFSASQGKKEKGGGIFEFVVWLFFFLPWGHEKD